ncbi:MAG: YdcF family protein, partial [Pseudomonadota bacterium]
DTERRADRSVLWSLVSKGPARAMRAAVRLIAWLLATYAAFCALALAAMLWGEVTAQQLNDGTRAEVVLVLGAIQNPDGTLHPSTQRRVDRAVAFYHSGQVSRLVMCGGPPFGAATPSTGALMAASAVSQGVPEAVILVEGDSHSTLQNTLFARAMLDDQPTLWVLTEGYHVPRGLASAAFAGLEVQGHVSAGGWSAPAYAAWGAGRELLAWPFNILRGLAFLGLRRLGVPEAELFPLLV